MTNMPEQEGLPAPFPASSPSCPVAISSSTATAPIEKHNRQPLSVPAQQLLPLFGRQPAASKPMAYKLLGGQSLPTSLDTSTVFDVVRDDETSDDVDHLYCAKDFDQTIPDKHIAKQPAYLETVWGLEGWSDSEEGRAVGLMLMDTDEVIDLLMEGTPAEVAQKLQAYLDSDGQVKPKSRDTVADSLRYAGDTDQTSQPDSAITPTAKPCTRGSTPIYSLHNATVEQVMVPHPVTLPAGMTCKSAGRVLLENAMVSAPVVDKDGHLIGVVSVSDLLKAAVAHLYCTTIPTVNVKTSELPPSLCDTAKFNAEISTTLASTVGEAVTQQPVRIKPSDLLSTVVRVMLATQVCSLPVVDEGGKVVGAISQDHVLRVILA